MGLEGWVGRQGEPTGGLEGLLTAVKPVGPEAEVEEVEEVVSKLAAVAAAVGVGQVLEQHRGKVAGYRPACSVRSPSIVSTFQLPNVWCSKDKQVRPNTVKLTEGKFDDHYPTPSRLDANCKLAHFSSASHMSAENTWQT